MVGVIALVYSRLRKITFSVQSLAATSTMLDISDTKDSAAGWGQLGCWEACEIISALSSPVRFPPFVVSDIAIRLASADSQMPVACLLLVYFFLQALAFQLLCCAIAVVS